MTVDWTSFVLGMGAGIALVVLILFTAFVLFTIYGEADADWYHQDDEYEEEEP